MEKDSKTLNKSYKFYISKKFPRQENMSDCGVFMLKGIHYKVKKEENMFNQNDIPYFRMLITLELLKGRLLETV